MVASVDPKWVIAASLFHLVKPILARQENHITLVNPQPTVWIKPGEQYQSIIDLNQDYLNSDPNQNLKISLQSLDGSPAPHWLSIGMGPLSSIFSRYLGTEIAIKIQIVGNIAYVLGASQFYTIDISNPDQPNVLASFRHLPFATGLSLTNDTAYILFTNVYLSLAIDIRNKTNLILVDRIQYTSNATKFVTAISDGFLYTFMSDEYIVKYRIYNKTKLLEVNSAYSPCYPSFWSSGIKIIEGFGYCFYSVFIHIFDINTLEFFYIDPHYISEVTSIAGNKQLLFIGATQHLFVYNNTNQKNPILIQTMYLGHQANVTNMFITDEYLYATCQDGGIVVIDIRDPKNAQIVSTFTSYSEPRDAVLKSNNLWVADGPAGLTTIKAGRQRVTGVPGLEDEGQYHINIVAQDEEGHTLTYTQTINVGVETIPPKVVYTLDGAVATVGVPFNKLIPQNTFSGSNLVITAKLSDGRPLPDWLKFDGTNPTPSFWGIPSSFDAGTFIHWVLDIEVTATNSAGSTKAGFKITILGESFWTLFMSTGATVLTAGISVYGGWQKRAEIWNFINKKKYEKEPQRAIVGREFSYNNPLEMHEIQKIEIYKKGNLLSPALCSNWLKKLDGTPRDEDVGRFTIVIYEQGGYIHAKFDLIVKKNVEDRDPDPEKAPTYKQTFDRGITEIHERFLRGFRISRRGRNGRLLRDHDTELRQITTEES